MDNLDENRMVISMMLAVDDAPAAVRWYKEALGATELWNLGSVAGLDILYRGAGEQRMGDAFETRHAFLQGRSFL